MPNFLSAPQKGHVPLVCWCPAGMPYPGELGDFLQGPARLPDVGLLQGGTQTLHPTSSSVLGAASHSRPVNVSTEPMKFIMKGPETSKAQALC